MIKYTIDDKTLVIPSGLGLGGQKSGSGGGVTPEEAAQIASAVTAEAIEEYDTELQVDLEDIRDAVSGNSEDISDLSGVTETISQRIGSLSGLTDDIAAISGQTTANTQDIGILSGQTTANTADIAELSGVTEAIEGNLETVSGKVGEVYDAIFYEDEGETYSQIDDLWGALDEKQDNLEAGSGISINDNVVSINPPGRAISLSETGRLQLNLGSGVTIGEDNELNLKIGDGLGFSGDTLVVSGGTGGGKTPIVLEEHYGDPTWIAIYNSVAQSAATMGVEEFAKNYDIYIKRLDDQQNPYSVKQAVGFIIQQGEDWDEELQDWVQTTWVTFNTFESTGNIYWLLSTGSRGLGTIGGFDGNVPHPKSAWINIDASGDVVDYNISEVDGALAQYNDNGTDYAFSMYLCCTPGDAERYRGNLQNFRKNYNNVNGNFFFRFVIDIDGTEYEAEYYWDTGNQQLVKIVFQTYKAYLQSILNS